jgi:symplekin
MEKLIDYSLLPHISSVNLILCMSAMSNIARYRSEYLPRVLQTFEKLLNELPPTLGKSQISSVKKQMKLQLITILKQSQYDLQSKIIDLLLKIGVSQNEINKSIPKMSESSRKRASNVLNIQLENELAKKARIFNDDDSNIIQLTEEEKQVITLIDDLSNKLSNKENIADLVLITMVMLPDVMPIDFKNKYKPVSAAGTQEQIKDLAKLFTSQINKIDENLIDKIELKFKQQQQQQRQQKLQQEEEMNESKNKQEQVEIALTNKQQEDIKKKILSQNKLQPKKISKVYKLTEVTKPLESSQIENILSKSFKRLLNCEDLADKADVRLIRNKVLLNYDNLPNFKNGNSNIFSK